MKPSILAIALVLFATQAAAQEYPTKPILFVIPFASGGDSDLSGRNVAHHNKQTGFWTKQAEDVIFSENLSYSHRTSDSSTGACMGFQYAPERVWFINNHIHDCEVGIGTEMA